MNVIEKTDITLDGVLNNEMQLNVSQPKMVESESQTDIIPECDHCTITCICNNNNNNADEVDTKIDYLDKLEISKIENDVKLITKSESFNGDNSIKLDSDTEEFDQLKPLMTDRHSVDCQTLEQKDFDRKDSYSSTDSDNSYTTYDQRNFSLEQNNNQNSDGIYSDENGKDSGCEIQQTNEIREIDTIPSSDIPDDLFSQQIVQQVEYYFSNDNILRDAFLLKHVRRNKEGFVSLKLVSSFKRVRQLTKDWRIVGHAVLKKSKKIELNDLGTKIRRIEPLPVFDETMPSRTVVISDLPVDKLCIERVSDIFSRCGEIALIRILRPGQSIPVDVRQFMNKYPEMQKKECALVEFTESKAARYARNLIGNFCVYEMVPPKKKTGKKAVTVTKFIENYNYHENNYERSRGGSGGPILNDHDYKYRIKRNNSDYHVKQDQNHTYPPRMHNIFNNENYSQFILRRGSNCSSNGNDLIRKYSTCSEGYSSCSDMSRRNSLYSSTDQSRRTSNSSDLCHCQRRGSNSSTDYYRNISHGSDCNNRRYNNSNPIPYERSYSTPQDAGRRISIETNYDRKLSTGSLVNNNIQYESCRRLSNGYDISRRISNPDTYNYGTRRTSIDSGYDRRFSSGSDIENSQPVRNNSFIKYNSRNVESVVRTPIGPDGSKGFVSRTRRLGQIIPPV